MTLLADMAADIGVMYNADLGHAETCTGPAGSFLGVFDNEYIESDAGGAVGVMSAEPILRTRDADALAQGAAVTVRTVGYTVVEILPDGNGETLHRLHRT